MIKYEDFAKLEIKIGRIASAEKVEKSDNLLKLQIDFGDFQRQIIAGIAQGYSPEKIINKQIPVIVNLEYKTIRGLESQGMIIATEQNKIPVLIHPEKEVPNGSSIK